MCIYCDNLPYDNRTFTELPQEKQNLENAHLIYVKNNKVFGLSEKRCVLYTLLFLIKKLYLYIK